MPKAKKNQFGSGLKGAAVNAAASNLTKRRRRRRKSRKRGEKEERELWSETFIIAAGEQNAEDEGEEPLDSDQGGQTGHAPTEKRRVGAGHEQTQVTGQGTKTKEKTARSARGSAKKTVYVDVT